MEVKVALRK